MGFLNGLRVLPPTGRERGLTREGAEELESVRGVARILRKSAWFSAIVSVVVVVGVEGQRSPERKKMDKG
jgi:hypothetical protein